jgi:hypothetical protein
MFAVVKDNSMVCSTRNLRRVVVMKALGEYIVGRVVKGGQVLLTSHLGDVAQERKQVSDRIELSLDVLCC